MVQPEVKLSTYPRDTHIDMNTDTRRGGTHRVLKQLVTQPATGKAMPSTSPKGRNHIQHKHRQMSTLLLLGWKRQDVTGTVHTRYSPSLQAHTHLQVLQVSAHALCSSIDSACILDPLYGPLALWLVQLSALQETCGIHIFVPQAPPHSQVPLAG